MDRDRKMPRNIYLIYKRGSDEVLCPNDEIGIFSLQPAAEFYLQNMPAEVGDRQDLEIRGPYPLREINLSGHFYRLNPLPQALIHPFFRTL